MALRRKKKLSTRRRIREGPVRKGIYILPNLITTAGLFAAFYAIVQATKGAYDLAAIGIFVAMVTDGLDGRIARWTKTSSDFGSVYDSLVDVIAFGLAPALILYEWALSYLGRLGWLVAFLYVWATALRLARFNSQPSTDKRYFVGLPSPAAAAWLAAMVWLLFDYGLSGPLVNYTALAITAAVAAAMVTTIPYRSFKDLNLKGKVHYTVVVAVVLGWVLIFYDPPRVLFVLCGLYALSGPVASLGRRLRGTHDDGKAPQKGRKSSLK